ncbi:MAG: radical SAM protein [Archaeoglobi archaeon]|nr:radical SAM protein [Candidatus Mnemosynella bozhongmuii]
MIERIEDFLRNAKYPEHCIHCEGIDGRIENPKHHPSYEFGTDCNLSCIFCYSKIAEMRGVVIREGYYGEMNPKAITISQFGEPFYYGAEKLLSVIRGLRDIFGDVRIDIQTNGVIFDERICREADIMMISLDAGSREKYRRICGRDAFERVLRSIEMSSKLTYTSVRTIFIPGVNDDELERIAKISALAHELFLQPVSLYREQEDLIQSVDLERAESLWEYLEVASRLSEIADVRIPGCLLMNLRRFSEENGVENLRYLRRNAIGEVPKIEREWKFVL